MIENNDIYEMMNQATEQIEQLKILENKWRDLLSKNTPKYKATDYGTYSNRIHGGINIISKARWDLLKYVDDLKRDIECNEYMNKKEVKN